MSSAEPAAASCRSRFRESSVFSLRTAVASHKGLLWAYFFTARNFLMP